MNKAKILLGKYLSKKYSRNNKKWLVTIICKIVDSSPLPFNKSNIIFENNMEAAKTNSKSLESNSFDYEKLMLSNKNAVLSPGIEFRHPDILSTF